MPHLRLARFKSRIPALGSPRGRAAGEGAARVLGGVALLAACLLLALFPKWWADLRTKQQTDEWSFPYFSLIDGMERRWKRYPAPPVFTTGDEAPVQSYLLQWPEVVALKRREGPSLLWIRQGTRLVSIQDAQDRRLATWFRGASGLEPGATWSPSLESDPDRARRPKTILAGENWLILKRWDIGSPEVEGILGDLSARPPMLRIGLFPAWQGLSQQPPGEPWGNWPNLQIHGEGVKASRWVQEGRTSMFGEEWIFFAVPAPALEGTFLAYHRRQVVLGGLGSLFVAATAGFLWRRRQRHLRDREKEAGRLAALTHSLKTPLAVVKMRCDFLRFGPEDPLQHRSELLALSEDVERLTSTIDHGLRLFKESHLGGAGEFRERIPPEWFEDMAAEMDTTFLARDRELKLELTETPAWASPATLRVALQTVLENSLHHGRGTTWLRTSCEGRRFEIRIADAGPGLSRRELERLGQGPARAAASPSTGLGLSLLATLAEDEGWGVDLHSDQGQGVCVVIQVPIALPTHPEGTHHA